ncbi:glucose-6-phosphate dehydrogenase [Neisseria gonorrhoeae]|uniref:Glucose-6-phosphate dehydrogenase n=1 Tax=Neisseria gonorrhoeae TaxID=485 RepID=A0A378VYV2_NEIGO|nr:glucose-6-phosphate dehydrogenase [Neisseria gonorrhoeae]
MKPLTIESVNENVVRGQYTAAKGMNGYLEEINVPQDSFTETYVAIKAEIENERWKGVPFYLRTGKRMAGKVAEIVLNFRPLQNHIFDNSQTAPNRLVIELQPNESVRLYTQVKTPGAGNKVEVTPLGVDLGKAVEGRRAEAYERLLLDVINGKLALFNRRDELEAAWEYVMPILETGQITPRRRTVTAHTLGALKPPANCWRATATSGTKNSNALQTASGSQCRLKEGGAEKAVPLRGGSG